MTDVPSRETGRFASGSGPAWFSHWGWSHPGSGTAPCRRFGEPPSRNGLVATRGGQPYREQQIPAGESGEHHQGALRHQRSGAGTRNDREPQRVGEQAGFSSSCLTYGDSVREALVEITREAGRDRLYGAPHESHHPRTGRAVLGFQVASASDPGWNPRDPGSHRGRPLEERPLCLQRPGPPPPTRSLVCAHARRGGIPPQPSDRLAR